MDMAIIIEKWMDVSFDGRYNAYSINLGQDNIEIEDNSMDKLYRFKGNKIIECEPDFINDPEGIFIVYAGEEQYDVYY